MSPATILRPIGFMEDFTSAARFFQHGSLNVPWHDDLVMQLIAIDDIGAFAALAYPRWGTDWPPLAAALLRAAQTSGALLVTTGNLYGYDAVDGPMTEGRLLRPNTEKGQVRVRIWNEALDAHRAGRIRTAEVCRSDYLGAGVVTPLTLLVLPKVLAGKRASAPADLDTPHS